MLFICSSSSSSSWPRFRGLTSAGGGEDGGSIGEDIVD